MCIIRYPDSHLHLQPCICLSRTPYYLAPEIARGDRYDEKCDVYSFGVLLLEMATRGGLREVFGGMGGMPLAGRICSGWRPAVPASIEDDDELALLGELIRECMVGKPNARPSIEDALRQLTALSQRISVWVPEGAARRASAKRSGEIAFVKSVAHRPPRAVDDAEGGQQSAGASAAARVTPMAMVTVTGPAHSKKKIRNVVQPPPSVPPKSDYEGIPEEDLQCLRIEREDRGGGSATPRTLRRRFAGEEGVGLLIVPEGARLAAACRTLVHRDRLAGTYNGTTILAPEPDGTIAAATLREDIKALVTYRGQTKRSTVSDTDSLQSDVSIEELFSGSGQPRNFTAEIHFMRLVFQYYIWEVVPFGVMLAVPPCIFAACITQLPFPWTQPIDDANHMSVGSDLGGGEEFNHIGLFIVSVLCVGVFQALQTYLGFVVVKCDGSFGKAAPFAIFMLAYFAFVPAVGLLLLDTLGVDFYYYGLEFGYGIVCSACFGIGFAQINRRYFQSKGLSGATRKKEPQAPKEKPAQMQREQPLVEDGRADSHGACAIAKYNSRSSLKKKQKQKKKKKKGASSTFFVVLILVSVFVYVLGVVPFYRSSSDIIRLVILVVFHPIFKLSLLYVVRDGILKKDRVVQYACAGLFSVEAIWSLIGRFFVTFSARAFDSALLGIIFVAVQEYFCRAYRVDISRFSRWVRGKPPMTDAQFARFKEVAAVEERQAMGIEIACIVVASLFELFFWRVRWIIDLGALHTADRVPLSRTFLLMGIQLLLGAFVDVIAQHSMLKQNIPMLCVWTGRSRIWIVRELMQFMMATSLLLLAMHVVPNALFCSEADVCKCDFTGSLPSVREHCGMKSIAKAGDVAALQAWCMGDESELMCVASNASLVTGA